MEQSIELANEIGRLVEAFSSGDGDTVERLTTTRDGLVFIGTDPDEWFDDVKSVRALAEGQASVGLKVEHDEPVAFEEGTVGWAANRGNFVLPDGTRVPYRLTAVFHRENGAWKLVQEHASVAVDNEAAIGTNIG